MKYGNLAIINAKIYTIDKNESIEEAMAIKDDKIIYIGSNEGINKYINENTKIIDANGNVILPGFIDSHTHPPGTALTDSFEVSLYGLNSIEEYQYTIREFIKNHKDIKAVYGRGWSLGIFKGEELSKGPKKEHLDEVSRDIPIILRAYDGHTVWLNSKAIEIFNIKAHTPCTSGGKIEINEETKELWGTLKESAGDLVDEYYYSEKEYMLAFELFQKKMHEYGITSILSISGLNWGMSPNAYKNLQKENKLKLRVSNSIMLWWDEDVIDQIDKIKRIRTKYNSNLFKTVTVKFLADGVVEGSTAYLLNPYEIDAGMGDNYYGEFLWNDNILEKGIKYSNENGFSIHVHSVGDGSTKRVLDIIENINLNEIDFRNTITHLQLVDKEDIKRFKKLKIIASTQPYWHLKAPKWWEDVDYRLLGDRARYEYPLKSFIKEGVMITSSSDHSVTPEPNPFYAIQAGVTRNLYNAESYGIDSIKDIDDERFLLNKEERISVMDMVKSFTINGAYAIFRENEVGSIEVGKYADFIIIDNDIFNINPTEIENTKVIMTCFNGKIVYKREKKII